MGSPLWHCLGDTWRDANRLHPDGLQPNRESTQHPCVRSEHHTLLQRLFQRFLADEADHYFELWLGLDLGNASRGGQKYPYKPFYGSFSPRVAVAWNPNFDSGIGASAFGHGKTVIRGGFSLLYGRLNGVDLVLVPLLGTGLIQAVQCVSPVASGGC